MMRRWCCSGKSSTAPTPTTPSIVNRKGPGLEAIAEGFRHLGYQDDHEQLNAAEWIVYDALYAYCQQMVSDGKPNGDFKCCLRHFASCMMVASAVAGRNVVR